MFKLVFSEKINDEIVSSINYIKNTLKSPMAAQNHVDELKKKYLKLKENPFARPLVQNKFLASNGIRFIMVKKYMLIYRVDEENNTVFLYRFIYCRRDWINILTNEIKKE
ncbi:MAG: type II toxin-antitoxin system RelE/ParE family toxin [Treponema sp.]|jgi:mRNA-degrading endonuclease RelE of RelBE toxin-antitoxin system|nr:type II toxin-antitoxin system RelE/ParE family toxin [Treponema sp.]